VTAAPGATAIPIAAEPGLSHKLTTLPSGVRIVTEAMPSVRSVALGYFVGTGSRLESDEQAGLSHLLEHLLFKGSERYASEEIDQIFDAMGAEINAGTGKESTTVYSRVIDEHLELAVDVMSEMVWRPALRDIDSEREVILEEIAMYEDDPQDKVFDVLGEAVFGADPLGRAIIGRADVVAGTPADAIAGFHGARYVPSNVVLAAAGSIDHDELVALAAARMPDAPGEHFTPSFSTPGAHAAVRFERKETEQFHVCLGASGLARDDDRRFALRVLDAVFGGTSSSRLFQEVREKRGLAYSVHSFAALYAATGQIGIYLGTRGDNLARSMEIVAAELERLRRDPASEAELARAKDNLKGRLVLSLESTGARMNRLGGSLLSGVPVLSLDESLARIDAVTLADVVALAEELWAPERLSVVGIGTDEQVFRTALEPLTVPAAA
jgi:predicted Zn-dependent peptidase